MTKTELSEHYANQKVLANPRNAFTGYSWDTQKKLTTFDGYDIEQAYEDGYDKAVELAVGFLHKVACGYAIRELLTGEPYEGKIIGDFKKYVEEEI